MTARRFVPLRILPAVLFLALGPAFLFAEVRVTLEGGDDDGLMDSSSVPLTATFVNESDEPVDGTISWNVMTVAYESPEAVTESLHLDGNASASRQFNLRLPEVGFAELECSLSSKDLEKDVVRRRRLGRNPEKVRVPLTRQPDFDSFWTSSLAELAQVEPHYEVREQKSENDAIRLFEITMHSIDSVRVRGWLEVPKSPGPHPVVLRVPGYGQNMRPLHRWDDTIVFSFNPRAHGNSQDQVPGEPVDYWIRGLDDKKTYYYRGAYLDCVRAVDYLATRDDVDQNRIAVWGGSQGGGFSFATAALDSRIDLCIPDIPFMCDWINYFKLTEWPEMDGWIEERDSRSWDSTLQTLSYFDALNLAERIECPTWMSIGLQDAVCPPTTDFAVFNRLSGKRSYDVYPNRGHGLGSAHFEETWDKLRKHFGLEE